jgi:hypothetical protein
MDMQLVHHFWLYSPQVLVAPSRLVAVAVQCLGRVWELGELDRGDVSMSLLASSWPSHASSPPRFRNRVYFTTATFIRTPRARHFVVVLRLSTCNAAKNSNESAQGVAGRKRWMDAYVEPAHGGVRNPWQAGEDGGQRKRGRTRRPRGGRT